MNQQPNKLTAYYYRAANNHTEFLHLDNQMHQLLHHAQENGIGAYALYVDNGYSGLTLNRPAIVLLQKHMADGQIEKIVVTGMERISRDIGNMFLFAAECAEYGISLETVNGENLYEQLAETQKLYNDLSAAYAAEKGGERE